MTLTPSEIDALKALPCFDRITEISLLPDGLSHTCVKVTTASQCLFVKKLNESTSATEVMCAIAYAKAERHGALSPSVIYHDNHWLVTNFIDGTNLESSSLTDNDKLSTALAIMTKLHQQVPTSDLINIPALDLTQVTQDLLNITKPYLAEKADILINTISVLITNINEEKALSQAPMVLCHGDINFSNIIIDDMKKPWLIDFECVQQAPIEYDVAMLIAVNNIPNCQLTVITETYGQLAPQYKLNTQLTAYYLLYSYFINGLWYLSSMNNVDKQSTRYQLALEQWSAFDEFSTTLSINLPSLVAIIPQH